LEKLKKEMPADRITRPPFWGGYVFKATYYEFWQGRKSRLHDRISYELKDNNWEIIRLAP
jgi:pyridoxamine 5'-phosphate oxidase